MLGELKDYAKCVVANKFTLGGAIFLAAAVPVILSDLGGEHHETIFNVAEAGLLAGGYIATRLTNAGLYTYRTYLRFRAIAKEDEELRGMLYEVLCRRKQPYCIQRGMELALRDS